MTREAGRGMTHDPEPQGSALIRRWHDVAVKPWRNIPDLHSAMRLTLRNEDNAFLPC
jgi:hypothetical protein